MKWISPIVIYTLLAAVHVASAVDMRSPSAATPLDLQKVIDDAVAAGAGQVTVAPGRYTVTPKNGEHLRLSHLQNFTINAIGVEMVCTQTTRAVTIDHCSNLTLRGLTIDYDPLPFTEGRITGVAADESWVEFSIIDGYPDQKLETRIEIYDPATQLLKTQTDYNWQPFRSLGNGKYRVEKGPRYHFRPNQTHAAAGDILVTNNASAAGGSMAHAICSSDCENLRLEDVTLYASNCFGFLEHDCNASTYLRCRLDRRSADSDPVKRGVPRLRSTDADAYHSIDAVKGPAILQCVAKFQGDDCVNIHGSYAMIVGHDGNALRVLSRGKPKIDVGDAVELITYDGRRLDDAHVVSISADEKVTAGERAFLMAQEMNESIRTSGVPDGFKIVIDRNADLPKGSVICSTRHTGNGFRVEGCDFGFNRSRGILMKASDGVIANNTITGTWGAAIQVMPEVWWLESGSSNNLVIDRNTITDCLSTPIEITAVGCNRQLAPSGAHKNIALTDNVITRSPMPAVWATSTSELRVNGTIVNEPTNKKAIDDDTLRSAGLDPKERQAIMVAHCDSPHINGNPAQSVIADPRPASNTH